MSVRAGRTSEQDLIMKPRFKQGDKVRVLELDKSGHIRTPYYVRHKTGEIAELCGFYLNPEDLSIGKTSGPAIPLYRVRFLQTDLWPEYEGPKRDSLYIEIYDHWLAPSTGESKSGPSS